MEKFKVTQVVPANTIWPNSKAYIDNGYIAGYVRGYNVEVKKLDGSIDWMSCVWVDHTIEDYVNDEYTGYWYADLGVVPTGRVSFRGYGIQKWDPDERDYFVERVDRVMEVLNHNGDTFEIVNEVPLGYEIWNIGKNMKDGYLPFCRVIPNNDGLDIVESETLKAIKCDGAQTILAAIGCGANTIEKMEKYIEKNSKASAGSYEHMMVERMKDALPIMKTLKWPMHQKGDKNASEKH